MSVLINVLGLAIPLAMLQVFDRVLPNQSLPTLDAIFVVMVSVVAADTLLKITRGRIVLANGLAADRALSRRLMDRLFTGEQAQLQEIGNNRLLTLLQSTARLRVWLSGQALLARVDLAFSAIYLALVAALGGVLVLIPLLAILGVAIVARRVRPDHAHAIQARDVNGTARMSFLRDVLNRVNTFKILGGEARLITDYAQLQGSATSAQRTLAEVSDTAFTISAMTGQVATGLLSLAGGYLVITGQIDLANLAACILLAGRAVQPHVQAFLTHKELVHAKAIATDLDEVLAVDTCRPPRPLLKNPDWAIEVRDLTSRTVQTADAEPLSFQAVAGSLITINGHGSGQASDILHALAGDRSSITGSIKIGGRPATTEAPDDGGPVVMLVPREPVLFQGTIRQNLAVYCDNLTDAQFVSGLLDVHTEIDMMPEGIDWRYEGGNRGGGSVGLRKKIALVAALASNSDILLLDKPGAGLDPVSQRLLSEHLVMTKGLATVVVANADESLVTRSDLHTELIKGGAPQLSNPDKMRDLDEDDLVWMSAMQDAPDDDLRKAS